MAHRLKTIPAHDWLLNLQEHEPSSELEALMMDREFTPRNESLLDLIESILTEEENDVLCMKVLGGMSFRQIARELGISVGKAHALHHRAIGKLRKELSEKL